MVTWIIPYVSVPRTGQYWSHFTCDITQETQSEQMTRTTLDRENNQQRTAEFHYRTCFIPFIHDSDFPTIPVFFFLIFKKRFIKEHHLVLFIHLRLRLKLTGPNIFFFAAETVKLRLLWRAGKPTFTALPLTDTGDSFRIRNGMLRKCVGNLQR